MLAIDISLSMRVSDVKPNRLVAAQEAAKLFLRDLPRDIEVGLVTFAGSTQVAQRATLDRASLVTAIDAFQMQLGTAVGDAIVLSLSELFPDHGLVIGETNYASSRRQGRSLDDQAKPSPRQITPVAPGAYDSAAIILLSDGRRTTGIETLQAAKMAADRGSAHLRGGPGHARWRRRHARRHADLRAAGRTHPARSGAHDGRRVPPCRHG